MKLKTSLHIHTHEDPFDWKFIKYSVYDLIDFAESKKFSVLAITLHEKFLFEEKWREYATEKWILLIPWIEINIRNKHIWWSHILVLNCDKKVEEIKTFEDLKLYKQNNPEIFVIAPHPGFDLFNSISLKNLEKYIDLFDTIEHSWFYTGFRNKNSRVKKIAKKYSKPIISTSDTHFLDFIDTDYTLIDSEKLEVKDIFNSIKSWKFENLTKPKKFLDLVKIVWKMI